MIVIGYFTTKHIERRMNGIIFTLCFGQLLLVHLYNYLYYYNVWKVDVTNSLMIVIQMIHSLACNYVDGEKEDSKLSEY